MFFMYTITNRTEPTRLILLLGANVHARDTIDGNTPLHWACSSGNHSVFKFLLEAGSDVTGTNEKVIVTKLIKCKRIISYALFVGETPIYIWQFAMQDFVHCNLYTSVSFRLVLSFRQCQLLYHCALGINIFNSVVCTI